MLWANQNAVFLRFHLATISVSIQGIILIYCILRWDNIQGDWDYQVATLQPDLAYYMYTDIWGGTYWDDIGPGMTDYVLTSGYSFTHIYCRFDIWTRTDWCWDTIVSEVGSGRPFVWTTTYGWGGGSLSTCGVGYDAGANDVILYHT